MRFAMSRTSGRSRQSLTPPYEHSGEIDTWVNVAAVSVYARCEETSPEEFWRVMQVNYLGQVHGALAALPQLRRTGQGALIAISSVESIVSLPLHSAYSASKHAVEGAMDAFASGVDGRRRPNLRDEHQAGHDQHTILQQLFEQDGRQAQGAAPRLRSCHPGGLCSLCRRKPGP